MVLHELSHSAAIATMLGLHVWMSVRTAVKQAKRTESTAAIAGDRITTSPILYRGNKVQGSTVKLHGSTVQGECGARMNTDTGAGVTGDNEPRVAKREVEDY